MTESTGGGGSPWSGARRGLVLGLIAGLAMVVFTVAARLVSNALTITELAADWFTEYLPPAIIDYLLETLTFSTKPLMFAGLLVAQVLVGGVAGAVYGNIAYRWPVGVSLEWARASGYALLGWLLSMVIMVPVFGGGFFGSSVPGGVTGFVVASLGAYAVYGLSLGYLVTRSEYPRVPSLADRSRRSFLRYVGVWALVAAAVFYGLRFLLSEVDRQMSPSGTFRTPGVLSTEITPNDEFYLVSKNILDPEVDVDQWSLEVTGLVEEPMTLTYDQLRAMPSVEKFVTLECISNWVGGDLISNAMWRGVPLKQILEEARLKPGVVDVSFAAWDGYSESLSLTKALGDEVLVVYEMNGEPLPSSHGFPARLIIPGFFGLKSVKWLTKIEPVDHDFEGYWQRRGWTDNPVVKTMSRFDAPRSGSRHPVAPVSLGGVAFAGDRGIAKVEVSSDYGDTWVEVEETSEPLSPYTWVIWKTRYSPPKAGRISLRVRATDGQGAVQTRTRTDSLPYGATGQHEIPLTFRKAAV